MAALLLIVALGGLALVTLGAAADRGPGVTSDGSGQWELSPRTQEPQEVPDIEMPTGLQQPVQPDSGQSGGGPLLLLIVVGAVLVALAVWVLYRMRTLARPAPDLAEAAGDEKLTPAQARAALDDARASLSTVVDAHDAVIAAWLALERAIGEAGIRRLPSRTTLEFVVEVLGTLNLDRSSLDRLAHLYRRALFDPEPLREADRDEAIGLLDRLTADVEAPADLKAPTGGQASATGQAPADGQAR